MSEYHVPETPDGEDLGFGGMRIVANPNVPPGAVEVHDENGIQCRVDWRTDFERWKRERT